MTASERFGPRCRRLTLEQTTDPRLPEQICIEDIAHGLSMLCRFSGQCPYFYSVAEHSIYLVHFLPDNLQLEGLLHDATREDLGMLANWLLARALEHDKPTLLFYILLA